MFEQNDIVGTDVLDHLGLVAVTISKLGIVEKIDQQMPMTQGDKTTNGERARQGKMRCGRTPIDT